jgi:predicted nucleic acid-binding protein
VILIVDSSVALKWFVDEPRHEAAKRLILAAERMSAPEWAYAEVINALWRKARAGEITNEQVLAAIHERPKRVRYSGCDEGLMKSAFGLAQQLEHSIYDCVFLALALQTENAVLVTDDGRFAEKAVSRGYADKLRWLSDEPMKLAFSNDEMVRIRRLHETSLATIRSVSERAGLPAGISGLNIFAASDLKPALESPAYVSLKRLIATLTAHQAAVLLALAWIGRGYDGGDFDRLYDRAAEIAAEPEKHAPYIISLIAYLDVGIAKYQQKLAASEVKE